MAASTDLAAEVGLRTWIARLRTDRVAIFPVSASKTSNAGAVAVASAAAVIASAVADSAAVIDLGVVGLAEAASADSAAAVGAADGNYLGLECASNFQ